MRVQIRLYGRLLGIKLYDNANVTNFIHCENTHLNILAVHHHFGSNSTI